MSFHSCSDPRQRELPDIDLPQVRRTSTRFIVDRNESGSDNELLNGKLVSLINVKNRLNITLSIIQNMYKNFLWFYEFYNCPKHVGEPIFFFLFR